MISAWFGPAAPLIQSDLFKRCIESWHVTHPDWNFINIGEESLPAQIRESPYVKGVLSRGEYVKATEVARLYGLWKHGGVYVDYDVELLKSFDPLRYDRDFFIGREDHETINGAVMGSAAYGAVITKLLSSFPLDSDGRRSPPQYGPVYLTEFFGKHPHEILPPEYFYPTHWRTKGLTHNHTDNTYAVHHWAASWEPYR